MKLWDFFRPPDRNEIAEWGSKVRLSARERGQLNQKLDMLQRLGFDTAHGLDFLAGPLKQERHIYKLVVHAGRMLRPMLCLGPFDNRGEMTLLCGAIEKDWELDPPDAPARAEAKRQLLIDPKNAGEKLRVPHERF
jgi:hypothetical protein